jgi:hypothetical protein
VVMTLGEKKKLRAFYFFFWVFSFWLTLMKFDMNPGYHQTRLVTAKFF